MIVSNQTDTPTPSSNSISSNPTTPIIPSIDSNRSNTSPRISSLDELRIELPNDVRRHLESQYEGLYQQQQQQQQQDDDSNNVIAETSSEEGAKQHLNRVLRAMKTPPRITTCRVNLILSDVEEVCLELRKVLSSYYYTTTTTAATIGEAGDTGDGGGTVLADGKRKVVPLFLVRRHPVINDLIEIYTNTNQIIDSDATMRSDTNDQSLSNHRRPPSILTTSKTNDSSHDIVVDEEPNTTAIPRSSISSHPNNPNTTKSTNPHPMMIRRGTQFSSSQWPTDMRVVICDRLCGEAVLRGSNAFVRGILAADLNIRKGERVALYAHLHANNDTATATSSSSSGNVPRGLKLVDYTGHCVFLGVGVTHCTRAEMFNSEYGLAIDMSIINNCPSSSSPTTTSCSSSSSSTTTTNTTSSIIVPPTLTSILNTRAGPILPPLNQILPTKMLLQNLPSTLVAHALDPQPGDTILDMCAAPGGKTAHLASLVMGNDKYNDEGGRSTIIVALDRSRKKVVAMREMVVSKMGASCVVPLCMDATKCVVRPSNGKGTDDGGDGHNGADEGKDVRSILTKAAANSTTTNTNTKHNNNDDGLLKITGFYPASFDRILLDPPCSALGLRPKLSITSMNNTNGRPLRLTELQKHTTYQRKFIDAAILLLKPGGYITISTCTIHVEENEGMVRYVLDKFGDVMTLVPLGVGEEVGLLGLSGLPGVGLGDRERGMVRRFDPSDDGADTMGFFIAKFKKNT